MSSPASQGVPSNYTAAYHILLTSAIANPNPLTLTLTLALTSFSLEWRMDDFAEEVWGLRRTANAWDGTVHTRCGGGV